VNPRVIPHLGSIVVLTFRHVSHWFPSLTKPEIGLVLLTTFLCLSASRVGQVGDLLGRLLGMTRR
jgi:hypothetical protein